MENNDQEFVIIEEGSEHPEDLFACCTSGSARL